MAVAIANDRKQREKDAIKTNPNEKPTANVEAGVAKPFEPPAGFWTLPEIPEHLDALDERVAEDDDSSLEVLTDASERPTQLQRSLFIKPVDEAFEDSDDDLAY